MLKFSKSHEWVKKDSDVYLIGITDYAQRQLGDIVFIELPESGTKLQRKGQLGTIESTKAASELYSPLTGEVIENNSELIDSPQLLNESPYDKGWMVKVKINDVSDFDNLMDEVTYNEFIKTLEN